MTLSRLDAAQIIQSAYDEPNNRIRVDANLSFNGAAAEVYIDQADDSILVYGRDSGAVNRPILTTTSGAVIVDVSDTVFTADQGNPNTVANAWPIKITDGTDTAEVTAANALKVDGSAVTQPVSATNLDIRDLTSVSDSVSAVQSGTWNITNITGTVSLPTGAATEATLATQSTFDHGSKSGIGTSPVQITASSITAKKGVTVKAAIANTGILYAGNSDVTNGTTDATDGFELGNGESCFIEVDNANKVYVIASTTGQKAFWMVT